MKNKKNLIGLLSLAVLLVVLIVGYLIAKTHNGTETDGSDETPEETLYVTNYDNDLMTKLTYETGGNTITLVKNSGGIWQLEDNELFPLRSTAALSMTSAVSTLTAARTVEGDDLAAYGLDAPSFNVTAEYSDGTTVSLSAGNTSSYGGEYVIDNISGRVYLVDMFSGAFYTTLSDIVEVDEFPDIDTAYLVSMSLSDKYGNTNTVTDEKGLEEAAKLFIELKFSSAAWVAAVETEKLSEYGISDSSHFAELAYKEESTAQNSDGTTSTVRSDTSFKLIFGDRYVRASTSTDEDGNQVETEKIMYYYTTPGSNLVYSVDESAYEKLMAYALYTPSETADSGE